MMMMVMMTFSTGEGHTLPVLELNKSSVPCVINTLIVFDQSANLEKKEHHFITCKTKSIQVYVTPEPQITLVW